MSQWKRDNDLTKAYIEARVKKDSETGCWLWQGAVNNAGYPQASKWGGLHRQVKTIYEGHEWVKGEMADHICRVKACVNPAHIRVTNRTVNQYHRADAAKGSMAKRRLRVARHLHDTLPERWEARTDGA